MKENSNIHSSKEFPMVISTWRHGLAANDAAMKSLLKGNKSAATKIVRTEQHIRKTRRLL